MIINSTQFHIDTLSVFNVHTSLLAVGKNIYICVCARISVVFFRSFDSSYSIYFTRYFLYEKKNHFEQIACIHGEIESNAFTSLMLNSTYTHTKTRLQLVNGMQISQRLPYWKNIERL